MDFTLYQASDSDMAFLLELRLKTMDEHLKNAGLFLTKQQHRDRVRDNFKLAHIISVDCQKIGFIKLEMSAAKITIFQFQILPEYQGKGYGRRILSNFMSEAKNKSVCLSVLKANPAYKLYQRLGFTKVDEDDYEYHLEYKLQ